MDERPDLSLRVQCLDLMAISTSISVVRSEDLCEGSFRHLDHFCFLIILLDLIQRAGEVTEGVAEPLVHFDIEHVNIADAAVIVLSFAAWWNVNLR